jgi:hypothetical protein
MAWSCGESATGDWVGDLLRGSDPLVIRIRRRGLVTPLELAAGRSRLGSTLTAIEVCQERFGGGQVGSAAGYLAHVPRGR